MTLGKQVKTFFRFGTVGLFTAAIYALILILVVEGVGLSAAIGAAIAYVLAVGFNYWGHYTWTYRTDRPHRTTGPKYIALTIAIFSVNVFATALLPERLGISYGVVQGLLLVVVATATFVTQTTWVFSRGKDSA
jgi:putative flippase GtrA